MKKLKTSTIRFIREYSFDLLIGVILATCFLLLISVTANAQNVGINNPTPHAKSLLDLTSTDKGLLAPRLTQAQRLAMFPAADATAKGMLVYQTDATQGFYYYDGAVWQSVTAGSSGWGLTGNAGTTPASNFLGTTDNMDLSVKTNNIEAIRIKNTGKVGIGTNNPGFGYASAKFEIADETGSNSDFAMRVAGGTGRPEIVLESSAGTLAAPTQSPAGAWAGDIVGQVYDGTQFTNTAAIIFGTEGVNSVNNVAGTIQFNTNKTGANGNEKMRLTSIGNLGVGVVNALSRVDVGGNVNVMLDSNYRINNQRVLSIKGQNNLFAGSNAGINTTSGGYNTFTGHLSGFTNTTGGSNAFFGQYSGYYNTTGNWNTFLGNNAGAKNTVAHGNVYVGSHSGYNNAIGANNTFVGGWAGFNSTDSNNVFVGTNAGYTTTVGKGNTFSGFNAGYYNSTGSNNTFSGLIAGTYTSTGSNNVMTGAFAGIGNTIGSGNTFIGSNADALVNNLTNATAIGYNAKVSVSNAIVLGQAGTNVGIGTSSPTAKLDVNGTVKITDGTQAAGKVLTSDASGNATWQVMNASGVSAWSLTGNAGTNVATNFIGTQDNNDVVFKSNNLEAFRIRPNQRIGMGTVSPNQKLDVNGHINISADSTYRIANLPVLSTKGIWNVFVGANAGLNNTGQQNVFTGYNSGSNNTTGSNNTFNGFYAGNGNTSAHHNSFFGYRAGKNDSTGTDNVAVGAECGTSLTTGSNNTYMGRLAGYTNKTSSFNVFVGSSAGLNATVGLSTFIGTNSGLNTTTGTQNTFVGLNSGMLNATGANNSFLGYYSGYNNTGSDNTFIGNNSGLTKTGGSGNTFIGNNADALATGLTNAGAIGANAKVGVSNAIALGAAGVLVGVGMSSPGYALNFPGVLGDKISFFGTSGPHYGIGVQSTLLQIHAATAVDDIAFGYGTSAAFSERMRVKGNGKVGIGTSTPGSLFTSAILEIADSTGGTNKDVVIRTSNNTNIQQVLAFVRTRGSYSTPASVQNQDNLGRISGVGYDGSNLLTGSEIQFHVDSIPGSNSMPGNISFHTTPANSGTVIVERMRIDRNGNVGVGINNPQTKLEVNGGFSINPNASTVITSGNFALTVGNNSYLRLGSNDIPANRSVVLSNGLQAGQLLMIESTASAPNGVRIADNSATNNTNTGGNRDLQPGDLITLLWNGIDWIEQNYSDN